MALKYNPLLSGKLDLQTVNLSDLADVNTAGTVDGDVLAWEQSSGTWKPSTAGAGDMLKSDYVTGQGTVYNASRLGGETLATVQAHGVDAGTITQGTIGLARVPTMDDAHIPNLDTLSYGAAFAEAQIPNLPTTKITSGIFNADRIPTLPNLKGTLTDAKIPDLDTLSYGAAFGTAQIPSIGAYKITSGTLAVARHETLDNLYGTVALLQIPTMDDVHIPDLDTLSGGAFGTAQIPSLGAYKIASGTLNADRTPILPTDRYGSAVLVSGTRSMTGDLDFAKHQAKAMAFEVLGSAPASPATAQMYYNSGDDNVYVYVA